MTNSYEILKNALKQIRTITNFIPKTAIVLGSGLGEFCNTIKIKEIIDYDTLEDFPVSTNANHNGRFILGYVDNVPIIAMDGRIHYYEGYSMDMVVMPIRLMNMLGANNLILTNAAGGINSHFHPGTLMIIKDHITNFVPSPLIGPNIDQLGIRFPDMTNVYNKKIISLIKSLGQELQLSLAEGTYIQVSGPNYETPAEIKMYKALGCDAVGMSTACEAMAANHCGMNVCGISCITNMASGITGDVLDDKEVLNVADSIQEDFTKLVHNLILKL